MKKATDIKPIPKHMVERIRKIDMEKHPEQKGPTRFYSYLTSIKGDLVKITVACKTFYKKWHCKQVVARGVKSELVWVKDMAYYMIAGYIVGWNPEGYKAHEFRRYADGKWYDDDQKNGIKWNPWSRTINPEYVAKFKEYQYSSHQFFRGDCIIEYLKLYLKFPQTEYLIKLGLPCLHDKVTILKLITKDKQFCKWLIRHRDEIKGCYAGVVIKSFKTGRPITQTQKIEQFRKNFKSNSDVPMLKELFGNLEKFYAYITSQDTDPYSYVDYIKACRYLRLDLGRRENLMPNNFQRMHDRRIEEHNTTKERADKKERAKLYKQFASVIEKYLILQNHKKGLYAVYIAKSPAELIHEGEQLNHCVGKMKYEEKVVKEEALIFFVRAMDKPDVPFVTVEYSLQSKKVLQCYGHGSKRPDDNVIEFVNKVWLPHANKQIKLLKEKQAS